MDKSRQRESWVIVITFLLIIFAIVWYVYQKNQTNIINFNILPSYRIQHVKSGKWLVVNNIYAPFNQPPKTNQPASNPFIPVLAFSDDPNSAFGVWNIESATKDSNGEQRWRLKSNLTKRYCNKLSRGSPTQSSSSYVCNGETKVKSGTPGPQFVKLDPVGTQNSSKTTGSMGPPVPTRFKMSVQIENGTYLPCRKINFNNNGLSENLLRVSPANETPDEFLLRFPITPLTAN